MAEESKPIKKIGGEITFHLDGEDRTAADVLADVHQHVNSGGAVDFRINGVEYELTKLGDGYFVVAVPGYEGGNGIDN